MSEAIDTVNPDGGASPEAESAEVAAQSEGTQAIESGADAQAVADAADPAKAKPVVEEDPEFEIDKDLRLRKSEIAHLAKKRKELDRASFERFEKASQVQKKFDALLQGDPEAYLRERGIDPVAFAVERLKREVALKEATPDQRRIMELEAERHTLLSEKQTLAQQQEQHAYEAEKSQFLGRIDKEMPAAMQKHGLPGNPVVARAVANVMQAQLANGIPMDVETAAEEVADAYRGTFKQHAANLNYETLQKHYPEIVKAVREGDLARAKSGIAAPVRPAITTSAPRKPANAPNGSKVFEDYFDEWSGMGIARPR